MCEDAPGTGDCRPTGDAEQPSTRPAPSGLSAEDLKEIRESIAQEQAYKRHWREKAEAAGGLSRADLLLLLRSRWPRAAHGVIAWVARQGHIPPEDIAWLLAQSARERRLERFAYEAVMAQHVANDPTIAVHDKVQKFVNLRAYALAYRALGDVHVEDITPLVHLLAGLSKPKRSYLMWGLVRRVRLLLGPVKAFRRRWTYRIEGIDTLARTDVAELLAYPGWAYPVDTIVGQACESGKLSADALQYLLDALPGEGRARAKVCALNALRDPALEWEAVLDLAVRLRFGWAVKRALERVPSDRATRAWDIIQAHGVWPKMDLYVRGILGDPPA